MTIALAGAPFPVTYRELWLPPVINSHATMPTSVGGGAGLSLTGARKGTTVDGVRGDGTATSNINCGANAVDNAAVKYWVSLRFRLDKNWDLGDGDQYLWGKFVDATHYIRLKLDSATGNLIFEKLEVAAGFTLSIASPDGDAIWHAGTWYHALCSISDVAAARFKVNDATLQTNVDANPMPNGGDLCFLDFDDPGAGTGFIGVEADIFCGIDDLTAAEETNLFYGLPPADAVHGYLLDEGRGLGAGIAIDRGSGADNGALDTSCAWAWGQVQQPVVSFDGVNDKLDSGGNTSRFNQPVSLLYVVKNKVRWGQALSRWVGLMYGFVDYNDNCLFWHNTTGSFRFLYEGSNVAAYVDVAITADIDDYLIIIGTAHVGGVCELFLNGSLIGSFTGSPFSGALGIVRFNSNEVGTVQFGGDKLLMGGFIEGAFTHKQALAYSRYLKNIFNLPISL